MRLHRAWVLALLLAACSKNGPETNADAGAADASTSTATAAPASSPAPSTSSAAPAPSADAGRSPCPDDMAYVDTNFCPEVERECEDVEHEKPNNLTICHKFKEGVTKCKTQEEHRQFCVDKYEYPNKKGAHPVWNATWFEAQATCKSKGKRLCWASEWTAACEGPKHTPFPYGWVRNHDTCNIDNFFIDPRKEGKGFLFSSKDKDAQFKELSRLDQSVRSGALEGCTNGFDVHDTTGNFDEWVISDQKPEHKSRWAGLKGGAWGHVRNQCRPMTFSHEPQEWYYFWSFRCCKDAEGAPSWSPPGGKNMPAPEVEAHDFFPDPIEPTSTSGPSKTKYGSDRKHE